MNVKKNIAIVFLLLISISLAAQNAMRVHYKDGKEQEILISEVDSVTFVEKVVPDVDISLI